MQFLQRENYTRHHKYNEDMLQYEYIKNGDIRGLEYGVNIFSSDLTGKLSDNPLRNALYLFICTMTLTTRFAIEGGMEPETAYNTSDVYIQSADKCKTIEEIRTLHKEMTLYFINQMAKIKKQNIFSRPIISCIDYIYENLHTTIKVEKLADNIGLNPSYLSTLFKKETGLSISEYIRRKRVEAAGNMLIYTDFSLTEISEYLAFCSYSYFADTFRKYNGCTPREYRNKKSAPGNPSALSQNSKIYNTAPE